MHIERRAFKDVPKDAIIISEQDALKHYYNHIFGTKQTKEIRPLKYGFVAAGFTAMASNFSLTSYYCRRVKLVSFRSKIMINFAFVAIPSMLAGGAHFLDCVGSILLQNKCVNCVYLRAALFQNIFSVAYGIGPTAYLVMVLAGMRCTYPIPGFGSREDLIETYRIWLKFTKRIAPRILSLVVLNSVGITFITYAEFKAADEMRATLQKQHEKLRAVAAMYQQEIREAKVR